MRNSQGPEDQRLIRADDYSDVPVERYVSCHMSYISVTHSFLQAMLLLRR